jgi:hypothetical protein
MLQGVLPDTAYFPVAQMLYLGNARLNSITDCNLAHGLLACWAYV